jgi:hypothetical protein
LHVLDAASTFTRHDFVVRRFAAYHSPERDDRVNWSITVREGQRHQRDLEGPRHPADGDIAAIDPGVTQDVERSFKEPSGESAVEAAADERDANAATDG